MKIFRAARAVSKVPPAGTWMVLSASSLITMSTSPPATSLLLATINTTTSERMTAVNMITPRITVTVMRNRPSCDALPNSSLSSRLVH